MKVSELIKILQTVKDKELNVVVYDYETGERHNIDKDDLDIIDGALDIQINQ